MTVSPSRAADAPPPGLLIPAAGPLLGFSASPYPGLRSFGRAEADTFFGRQDQTVKLLQKLQQARFLAVVGSSGCGKSSLVRAGLISALEAGFLTDAGSRWRFAEMRPGSRPLSGLALSLLAPDALGPAGAAEVDAPSFLLAALRRGPLGLVEALRDRPLPERTNLLLLVDQFEEIFRFRRQGDSDEADAFVALLIATAAQRDVPVYVVFTMRSDFLGDCAVFTGLPEAINESQFLTPRLTREQCRLAIEGPARVFGGGVDPALSNHLLNEMGTDSDQLPLLQHALLRMWGRARTRTGSEMPTLTLDDYAAVESLADALSDHADEALAELDAAGQEVARVLFRRLAERGPGGRDTRRAARLSELAAVAAVPDAQAAAVVNVFRGEGRSFLMPPADVPLAPDTVVDITHESLIRQWKRLQDWVAQEDASAARYRRLCETARLWAAGQAAPWGMPDLGDALRWKEEEKPTPAWALRYGSPEDFTRALAFLEASVAHREAVRRREEEVQARDKRAEEASRESEKRLAEARKLRRFGLVLGALACLAVVLAVYAGMKDFEAAQAHDSAIKAYHSVAEASKQERLSASDANNQRLIADELRRIAQAHRDDEEKQYLEKEHWIEVSQHYHDSALKDRARALDSARVAAASAQRAAASEAKARKSAAAERQLVSKLAAARKSAQDALALNRKALHREHIALRSSAITYSANDAYLLSIAQDGAAVLHETRDGTTQKNSVSLKGDASPVTFTGFSPDSWWVVVAHQSGVVDLYDTPQGQDKRVFRGHAGPVRKADFSPDGRLLATASDDGTAKIWDITSGRLLHTLADTKDPENAAPMIDVRFSSDGTVITSSDTRGVTTTWNTLTGKSKSRAMAL